MNFSNVYKKESERQKTATFVSSHLAFLLYYLQGVLHAILFRQFHCFDVNTHLCVWALRPFRSGHRTPKKDLSYGTRLGPQRDIENDIVASILSFQVVFFGNSRHVGLVQLLTPIG